MAHRVQSGNCLFFSLQTKVDEKLDTRRAIVVVETILSHFSERKFLITDYYEHWKVHVVSGKEFKSQWQQFVQNARKVPPAFFYLLENYDDDDDDDDDLNTV